MTKRIVLVMIVVFFCVSVTATAQSIGTYKLTTVSISNGKTPLSSGLDFSAVMKSSSDRKLEFIANAERAHLVYSIPFGKYVYLEASGGVKNNTPWLGPRMTVTAGKWKLVLWSATSAGRAGDPQWTTHWLLDYESISYSATSRLEVAFASVRYQKDDRKNVPNVSYKLPVGSVEFKGQASYDLTNDDPMFQLGVKYSFDKK